jgi:PEP-CTERM motif
MLRFPTLSVSASALLLAAGMGLSAIAHADPIIIAGGGGGAGYYTVSVPGGAGQTGTAGQNGSGPAGGAGGVNGSGGGGGTDDGGYNGGGGGGWNSAGGNGVGNGPTPAAGGSGNGGSGPPTFAGGAGGGQGDGGPSTGVTGGYGGGGGGGWQGGGGGGGYSGGGGGDGSNYAGGGGGSYFGSSVIPLVMVSGFNGTPDGDAQAALNGYVTIEGLTTFDYTGGLQSFVVPYSAYYEILAVGAEGGGGEGSSGGYGAEMLGQLYLDAGTTLDIVVGGGGVSGDFGTIWGGSGGGGSFVYTSGAISSVPEPGPLALLGIGIGLLGLAGARRYRRRSA